MFCGSSVGNRSEYAEAARKLAEVMAASQMGLVYGGARVGIMNVLAESLLQHQMQVTGVMPKNLVSKEVAHMGLTELIIVDSMAERKEKMVQMSDGFIAMPGGFGTLDELSEIMTYNQLRITDKPLGILNVNGYFDGLLEFVNHGVGEGFIRKEHGDNLMVSDDAEVLLKKMEDYQPITMAKWIDDIMLESNHK